MKTVPFDFDAMKKCSCILEFVVPEHINIFEEVYFPFGQSNSWTANHKYYDKPGAMRRANRDMGYLCFRFENGEWSNMGSRDTYEKYEYRHYRHMVFDPDLARSNFIEVGDLL